MNKQNLMAAFQNIDSIVAGVNLNRIQHDQLKSDLSLIADALNKHLASMEASSEKEDDKIKKLVKDQSKNK